MTKILQDKALDRWDTLPMVLREALLSEPNSDFLWKTCTAEHIPDEKIYDVARISGYVLMGFLHPEDIAEALHSDLGVDPKTATAIQTALNQRIFTPLRAFIDQVYEPLSKHETGPQMMDAAPVQMSSISMTASEGIAAPKPASTLNASLAPTAPAAPAAPKIAPQVFSQSASNLSIGATSLASNKSSAAPAPAPVKPGAPNSGWSNQTRNEPVVQLGAITPKIPVAPASPSANTTPALTQKPASMQPAPGMKVMSEFERMDMLKKQAAPSGPRSTAPSASAPATTPSPTPTASATPTTPAAPAAPAPVMLHEVSAPATQQSNDFHVESVSRNQINAAIPPRPAPAKPAVLEFGGQQPAATPESAPAAKVVHYSEYQSSAAPTPTPAGNANAPRQITELTARMPLTNPPGQMPTQPPMPKPAAPGQPTPPPTGKVIVKDFLGPQK